MELSFEKGYSYREDDASEGDDVPEEDSASEEDDVSEEHDLSIEACSFEEDSLSKADDPFEIDLDRFTNQELFEMLGELAGGERFGAYVSR